MPSRVPNGPPTSVDLRTFHMDINQLHRVTEVWEGPRNGDLTVLTGDPTYLPGGCPHRSLPRIGLATPLTCQLGILQHLCRPLVQLEDGHR